jgi:hypothetical protein
MTTAYVSITETTDAWVSDAGHCWSTAAEAERSVRQANTAAILVIDWHPVTAIGRSVVKAVTGCNA